MERASLSVWICWLWACCFLSSLAPIITNFHTRSGKQQVVRIVNRKMVSERKRERAPRRAVLLVSIWRNVKHILDPSLVSAAVYATCRTRLSDRLPNSSRQSTEHGWAERARGADSTATCTHAPAALCYFWQLSLFAFPQNWHVQFHARTMRI